MRGFFRTRLDLVHGGTHVAKAKEAQGRARATNKQNERKKYNLLPDHTCIFVLIYVKSPLFIAEAISYLLLGRAEF